MCLVYFLETEDGTRLVTTCDGSAWSTSLGIALHNPIERELFEGNAMLAAVIVVALLAIKTHANIRRRFSGQPKFTD